MFLSPDELQQLTGAKTRPRQLRWLARAGWRFTTDFRGRPIVARAEMERQLVSQEPSEAKSEPAWDKVA